jgi:hypothetical protein
MGKKKANRAKLNGLTSHMSPREAGHVMINKEKPKKTIFGSCKPQHIPLTT